MAAIIPLLRRISQTMPKRIPSSEVADYIYTSSGGFMNKPDQTRFALVKVMAVVFPFLYAGATLSKNGAAFLEENDIFVPDDDDD